jgi:hypothetical protein
VLRVQVGRPAEPERVRAERFGEHSRDSFATMNPAVSIRVFIASFSRLRSPYLAHRQSQGQKKNVWRRDNVANSLDVLSKLVRRTTEVL